MKYRNLLVFTAFALFISANVNTYANNQLNMDSDLQTYSYPDNSLNDLNFTDPTANYNLLESALDSTQEAPALEQTPTSITKKPKHGRIYNFPYLITATGKRTFIFNPNTYSWAAYDEKGQLVKQGPASGGAKFCKDINENCQTPDGAFNVIRKYGPKYKSSIFPVETKGGAPMPYAMFFYRGDAIHGSNYVPAANVSHGCIRILPADAEWLNKDFLDIGSMVIVYPYTS